ncbi:MAG: proton-conducting transporter membrane subunit [Dehalogenimonas sp.]
MDSLIIYAFALPAIVIAVISFYFGRHRVSGDGRALNTLVIAEAVLYLGLASWLLMTDSPRFLLENHYLFFDTLSGYEAVITSALFLLAAVYARGYIASLLAADEIEGSLLGIFYAAFALLPLVIIMGFLSNNLALLWIFIELSTLFSVVLLVTLKARENITAALKYVFVTSTAMLFAFIGIIILFALSREAIAGGSLNWTELMTVAANLSPRLFSFAFVFLFIGFAAKAGIVPFHTWLPAAYVRAPSVVAVMYGAVINLGLYAVLRTFAIGRNGGDEAFLQPLLIGFGVVSILIGALSIIARTNTKKLIAFSGVEQAGLILLAFGLSTPLALFWALFHKFGNALIKALLFFSAGIFHRQYRSNKYFTVKNPFGLQPLAAWGLIAGSAAAIGVPALPVFLAKFNILTVAASQSILLFLVVLIGFLLTAAGFGYYLIRAFSNDDSEDSVPYQTPSAMKIPIITTLILLFALGLYLPGWLESVLNNIVTDLGW